MSITFRPIQTWPRKMTSTRKSSQFASTYPQTLELLEKELDAINARNVVLQVALSDYDIRKDGLPRANARPMQHPGVILTFEKWIANGKHNDKGQAFGNYKSISFPCDTFSTWEENLRAIALSLEALRRVDRYGVTQGGEQYEGFPALPPASNNATMSREEAAAFLCAYSDIHISPNTSAERVKEAYRTAARKLHPDALTGSQELFLKLKSAVETLEKTP